MSSAKWDHMDHETYETHLKLKPSRIVKASNTTCYQSCCEKVATLSAMAPCPPPWHSLEGQVQLPGEKHKSVVAFRM